MTEEPTRRQCQQCGSHITNMGGVCGTCLSDDLGPVDDGPWRSWVHSTGTPGHLSLEHGNRAGLAVGPPSTMGSWPI